MTNRRGIGIGKSAAATDFISDIFAFFLYVAIFVLFILLFSITFKGCDKIAANTETITSREVGNAVDQQTLENYLKTDIAKYGSPINESLSELIGIYCLEQNKSLLEHPLEKLLGSALNINGYTSIEVDCKPGSGGGKLRASTIGIVAGGFEDIDAEDYVPIMQSDGKSLFAKISLMTYVSTSEGGMVIGN